MPRTVGILGGGQLGRMLALAGHNLGIRTRCWDQDPHAVAGHVTELHADSFEKPRRLDDFLQGVDVVTTEWENVPAELLELIASRGVAVSITGPALRQTQDRLLEKQLAARLGIPVPPNAAVDTREQLHGAIEAIGTPCVVKTRRFGYDGKGQFLVRTPADADACWRELGDATPPKGAGLIVEGFVRFDREVSVIIARSTRGEQAIYPLARNTHHKGILDVSIAPADDPEPNTPSHALDEQAAHIARSVATALDYTGVLAVELFQVGDQLLFNEIAPRVHNSGHWTIDGAHTSQFENHLRAVLGLPLGACACIDPSGACAMVNLIGMMPPIEKLLAIPHAKVHDYGKSAREGRKLGHVNVCAPSRAELDRRIAQVKAVIAGVQTRAAPAR